MLLDVRADHLKIVQEILQKFVPEHEVWAFGSRAKWLAKEYSDLDLCIIGDSALSFSTLGLLEEAFEDSDLPYKVDLVDWATTSESFRKIIERDRVVVQKGGRCGAALSRSEWSEKPLGDVVELKRGYDLPKDKRSKGKVPIISSSGITDYHAEPMVQGPGVVTGRYGTIGEVFFVEGDYWPLNTTLYVRDFKGNCALFVSYLLRTLDFHAYSDKGAVPGVNRNHLHMAMVRVPDRVTQEAIAKVLNSLDRKITLNRRINQTLEAMAQAIFKSWFVDFDPVKAKIAAIQEGRDPLRAAMSAISGKSESELDALSPKEYKQLAATAALFPDEMEESELGEIPRGWTATPIRDVAAVVKGKSYSSKDLVDNDQVALVTLKSFERGGGFRMDGFKPYVGSYKPEQVVSPGDLIVAYTDVTQAAELIGKPAIVVGVEHFKTLVASLDVGIVRPVNERVSRQFLYGLFMTEAFQSHTFAHTSGTTVLHLAKEGVPSYIFTCPDERLVGYFSEAAEAMAMEKQKLLDQNRSLATLRDTLLPKLLSGELSVTELDSNPSEVSP